MIEASQIKVIKVRFLFLTIFNQTVWTAELIKSSANYLKRSGFRPDWIRILIMYNSNSLAVIPLKHAREFMPKKCYDFLDSAAWYKSEPSRFEFKPT